MLRDSDPAKWACKAHTRIKHELLEKYLEAWIPILASGNRAIAYIDGFAGRGVYEDGSPGSPIRAMRLADRLAPRFNNVRLLFVEKDPDNHTNLSDEVSREQRQLRYSEKIDVQIVRGEFDREIQELLDYIDSEKAILIPSFFFVDPFGFTGVSLKTVGRILAMPKTEVFFTFMSRDINRFLMLDQLDSIFTELFGGEEWKPLVTQKGRSRIRALVELYRWCLHERVGARYSVHFKVCESDSTAPLYHLVHANNHIKGHNIMKGVMFRQGVAGTFAFLGKGDLAAQTQMRLFDLHDVSILRGELTRRFSGQVRTFDGIIEAMCHPWNEEPPFIERHYREAIKQMEEDGLVSIARVSSKTRGLKKHDRVTFLARGG